MECSLLVLASAVLHGREAHQAAPSSNSVASGSWGQGQLCPGRCAGGDLRRAQPAGWREEASTEPAAARSGALPRSRAALRSVRGNKMVLRRSGFLRPSQASAAAASNPRARAPRLTGPRPRPRAATPASTAAPHLPRARMAA